MTRTKKKKFKNVIVLLSGGLDSSTLAYLVAGKSKPHVQNRVFTLTFDYGQRHKKELFAARKVSKEIGAVNHIVINFDLTKWGGSSLTSKSFKVPQNKLLNNVCRLTKKSIPNTYVPARNTIFLSFALGYAETVGAKEIYIGVNHIDYSGYVDCRPDFIKRFQELAKVATVVGVKGGPVKIKTPLINFNKSQIIRAGQKLGVDWSNTWSCYLGRKLACGLCDSCQLRLQGFMRARIRDPLRYKTCPPFYKNFLQKNS